MTKQDREVILITGASSGIGLDLSIHLARRGHTVFAGVRNQRDHDRLNKISEYIIPLLLDVTRHQDIKEAKITLQKTLDPDTPLVLINNAGISALGPIETTNIKTIKQIFDVNFFGAIQVIQEFLPILRKNGGKIITISSIAGLSAFPFGGVYGASKHAIEAAQAALRVELKDTGVQVVSILPGNVKTPIWNKVDSQKQQLDTTETALYQTKLQAAYSLLEKSLPNAMEPSLISDRVVKIIKACKPAPRYIMGRNAKIQFIIKRLLPTHMFDSLKHMVISREAKKTMKPRQ